MWIKLQSGIHFFNRKKNDSNKCQPTTHSEHKIYSFKILGPNDQKVSFDLNLSKMSSCGPIYYAEIERQTKIPQRLQLLTYKSRMISPRHLACDCGFVKESTIHLSVKGLGGGGDGESQRSGQSDEGVTIH